LRDNIDEIRSGIDVCCRGTRGSIPVPGPQTVRFGGNTSCVEVHTPGARLILDAGTGIRSLGAELGTEAAAAPLHILLSHHHWDHIQGLPFFAPLYDAACSVSIHSPETSLARRAAPLDVQLSPMMFPVSAGELAATLHFPEPAATCEIGDATVRSYLASHAVPTRGFRIECRGLAVVYFPDNELETGDTDHGRGWYDGLVEFIAGADLLIHDAMFTDDEYAERKGWGHSTMRQAVQLAARAAVSRLWLFHHAPDRTDAQLVELAADFADARPLVVELAEERRRLRLPGAA
jgi:phosphoribosyl 1,2-cyclic phosphodiesterase